jgi:hypothetical protein
MLLHRHDWQQQNWGTSAVTMQQDEMTLRLQGPDQNAVPPASQCNGSCRTLFVCR